MPRTPSRGRRSCRIRSRPLPSGRPRSLMIRSNGRPSASVEGRGDVGGGLRRRGPSAAGAAAHDCARCRRGPRPAGSAGRRGAADLGLAAERPGLRLAGSAAAGRQSHGERRPLALARAVGGERAAVQSRPSPWLMARPRPRPPNCRVTRRSPCSKASKIRGSTSGSMPIAGVADLDARRRRPPSPRCSGCRRSRRRA